MGQTSEKEIKFYIGGQMSFQIETYHFFTPTVQWVSVLFFFGCCVRTYMYQIYYGLDSSAFLRIVEKLFWAAYRRPPGYKPRPSRCFLIQRELYSTLSPFTQVKNRVPATCC